MTNRNETGGDPDDSIPEQGSDLESSEIRRHGRDDAAGLDTESVLLLDSADSFPLRADISQAETVEKASTRPITGDPSRLTVLLAGDDGTQETQRCWLENNSDWNVRMATDGIDTLAKLDSTVDALVVDRTMSGLSAPELLARLKETSFTGQVLVISALSPDQYLDEDDAAGYLIKPVCGEDLVTSLEELLEPSA